MSESSEQQALIQWAETLSKQIPELNLLYAIPNGGKRNIATAVRLKKEGVKAGVPDLCLPVARKGFHGLYIEMKVDRNKPTGNQMEWMHRLSGQGYAFKVCWGWEEAKKEIEKYLGVV
jgi:hypothetical protein